MSIRGKTHPGERCQHPVRSGSEWCGIHGKQTTPIRWAAPLKSGEIICHQTTPDDSNVLTDRREIPIKEMAAKIIRIWRRWITRRCGPLLWCREESNNPYDFFSSDPVQEIPLQYFVSFVDGGKGYIMDSRSAISLLEFSKNNQQPLQNPFNRVLLPQHFLHRLSFHTSAAVWEGLKATNELQVYTLAVTDLCRNIEDLDYYSNPTWILDLDRFGLMRFYIELADIWFHRAMLSDSDRGRIVPGSCVGKPFRFPVQTALVMAKKALQYLVLDTCKLLVNSSTVKADRQLGVIYILGALSSLHRGVSIAYPAISEMFHPGVTRIVGGQLSVTHPIVLSY